MLLTIKNKLVDLLHKQNEKGNGKSKRQRYLPKNIISNDIGNIWFISLHYLFGCIMIDFKATHELNQVIGFINHKGETVRTYHLTELENFVINRRLNDYCRTEHVSGTGMPCDPNNVEREVTGYVPVNEWLDDQDNFVYACELFYKHKNPHEFKSFNHEQQTIRRVG